MTIAVPTLSAQKYVIEPAAKLDFLLTYFLATDAAQSTIFAKSTTSLQAIVESYSGDPQGTASEITNQLTAYLSRYYTAVNVESKFSLSDPDNSESLIKITTGINYTEDDGKTRSVTSAWEYYQGKFIRIVEANNG